MRPLCLILGKYHTFSPNCLYGNGSEKEEMRAILVIRVGLDLLVLTVTDLCQTNFEKEACIGQVVYIMTLLWCIMGSLFFASFLINRDLKVLNKPYLFTIAFVLGALDL